MSRTGKEPTGDPMVGPSGCVLAQVEAMSVSTLSSGPAIADMTPSPSSPGSAVAHRKQERY